MAVAETYASLSTAVRLKVGAIVVKDNRVISIGYNGMPSGWDNNCEDEIQYPDAEGITLKTKPEVLHAETNAIAKLARSSESGLSVAMFVTHAPCLDCAKLIYQSGILVYPCQVFLEIPVWYITPLLVYTRQVYNPLFGPFFDSFSGLGLNPLFNPLFQNPRKIKKIKELKEMQN
jgi:dCMP deaminase